MVDQFLLEEIQREMLWFETPLMNQSAFVPYLKQSPQGFGLVNSMAVSNHRNMNKRMIKFLRANPKMNYDCREFEKDRCHRHMINERLRREKEKQGYTALHSLLPPRTKMDKNTIVQTAHLQMQMLKGLKEELKKQNCALEENLKASDDGKKAELVKFRYRVKNPSSSIDSMVGVLRCLKSMDLKAKAIRSEFSVQEFSAVMEIDRKIEAPMIAEAVKRALAEVERKQASDLSSRKG